MPGDHLEPDAEVGVIEASKQHAGRAWTSKSSAEERCFQFGLSGGQDIEIARSYGTSGIKFDRGASDYDRPLVAGGHDFIESFR